MNVMVVGVDCATRAENIGLALAEYTAGRARLVRCETGAGAQQPAQCVAGWIGARRPALLALDSPLGWPRGLGRALAGHRAGQPLGVRAESLFRRATDHFVKARIGKQTLDVGADRIARTARAALALLEEVSAHLHESIPLAWNPEDIGGVAAIEVYPAGTLRALGLPASGYKKTDQRPVREAILQGLVPLLDLPADTGPLLANADILDAAICVLAAADFLDHRAMAPEDLELAAEEGWIWVRRPG